jgi:hypothetical protein
MQTRVFFVLNRWDDDYDPATSLEVISRIKALASGVFNDVDNQHQGMKVARMVSSGDAKLTVSDILAWDDFVTNQVMPDFTRQINALTNELKTSADYADKMMTYAYETLINILIENQNKVSALHKEFMAAFNKTGYRASYFVNSF